MRNVKGNVFKKIIAVMLTAATVLSPAGTTLSGVETVYATESDDYYRYELSDESVIFGKKSSTQIELNKKNSSSHVVDDVSKKAKWKIKDTSIAGIMSKKDLIKKYGRGDYAGITIYGKKYGTTTLTATYKGKTYTCKVTVAHAEITSSKLNMDKGTTKKLEILDLDRLEWVKKNVKWKSSNKSIATVTNEKGKGKVTAKKCGEATITGTYKGRKYTCKVVVKNPISKKKLTIEEVPFIENGKERDFVNGHYNGEPHKIVKITNHNDYTVQFSVYFDYFMKDGSYATYYYFGDKENESEKAKDFYAGTCVLNPGESVMVDKMEPVLYKDYEVNGEYRTDFTRIYDTYKVKIKDFMKSKNRSLAKYVKIDYTLDKDGSLSFTITNTGKKDILDLFIVLYDLNHDGKVQSIYASGCPWILKSGETYKCNYTEDDPERPVRFHDVKFNINTAFEQEFNFANQYH